MSSIFSAFGKSFNLSVYEDCIDLQMKLINYYGDDLKFNTNSRIKEFFQYKEYIGNIYNCLKEKENQYISFDFSKYLAIQQNNNKLVEICHYYNNYSSKEKTFLERSVVNNISNNFFNNIEQGRTWSFIQGKLHHILNGVSYTDTQMYMVDYSKETVVYFRNNSVEYNKVQNHFCGHNLSDTQLKQFARKIGKEIETDFLTAAKTHKNKSKMLKRIENENKKKNKIKNNNYVKKNNITFNRKLDTYDDYNDLDREFNINNDKNYDDDDDDSNFDDVDI